MANRSIDERLTAVEQELARLKHELHPDVETMSLPWWEQMFGTFAASEAHEEATRLGREYRESLRPTDEEDLN